jgi:hypothetical protein
MVIGLGLGFAFFAWREWDKHQQSQERSAAAFTAERRAKSQSTGGGRRAIVREYATADEFRADAERMVAEGWKIESQSDSTSTNVSRTVVMNWVTGGLSGTNVRTATTVTWVYEQKSGGTGRPRTRRHRR